VDDIIALAEITKKKRTGDEIQKIAVAP